MLRCRWHGFLISVALIFSSRLHDGDADKSHCGGLGIPPTVNRQIAVDIAKVASAAAPASVLLTSALPPWSPRSSAKPGSAIIKGPRTETGLSTSTDEGHSKHRKEAQQCSTDTGHRRSMLRTCLSGCPDDMDVEVKPGVPFVAKTLADIRALNARSQYWALDCPLRAPSSRKRR